MYLVPTIGVWRLCRCFFFCFFFLYRPGGGRNGLSYLSRIRPGHAVNAPGYLFTLAQSQRPGGRLLVSLRHSAIVSTSLYTGIVWAHLPGMSHEGSAHVFGDEEI